MKLDRMTVGPFEENTYLVRAEGGNEGYIIDPGDEAPRILAAVRAAGMTPVAIVNTHGHLDHVGAVAALQAELGLPFWIHRGDEFLLTGLTEQARLFGLAPLADPRPDRWLDEGDEIPLGAETFRVIHLPGHTPGGIGLLAGKTLIVGDTLFAGSVGRTDLPGGDWETLARSIRERLLTLPDDVEVWPGHGPRTTIGAERRTNPFLVGL